LSAPARQAEGDDQRDARVTLPDITTLQPDLHGHDVTEEMLERRLEDVRQPMAEITPSSARRGWATSL